VVVPFAGADADRRRIIAALQRIERRPGDELIVADNRPSGRNSDADAPVRVVAAAGVRSPGFARNRGAAIASGEWLVFIDADTTPAPDLIDRYFDPLPPPRVALLAGTIVDVPGSQRLSSRLTARRGQMSHRITLDRVGTPYAQTANCAVRRAAFAAVGGFDERARCGEDADLGFRLLRAGWQLQERPGAVVEHPTRPTLAALLAQLAGHGSGVAWLNRRYPGEFPAAGALELTRRLGRAAAEAGAAGLRRDRQAAAAALIELVSAYAFELGRLLSNRAPDA
jgi:GT2 family glycosyltransferase